jgi:hypothetical protein
MLAFVGGDVGDVIVAHPFISNIVVANNKFL